MGKENFIKAFRKFLIKHKYNNAVTQDLWDALDEQIHVTSKVQSLSLYNFYNSL